MADQGPIREGEGVARESKGDRDGAGPRPIHDWPGEHRLAHLRIAYFEPLREIGNPLAAILRADEGAQVEHVWHLHDMPGVIAATDPDLLLLEADTDEAGVLALVRRVRRHRIGPDPAVFIFTMRSTVTPDCVQRHAQAGVDTLLDKPLSQKVLTEHVTSCARRPRLCVLTPAYIGPERRRSDRVAAPGTVLQVPNRIQAVLAGHRPEAAAAAAGLKPLLDRLAVLARH